MVKVGKCCCCIPVATGILILGALDVLAWLTAVYRIDMFSFFVLLLPTLTFIMMIVNDCRQNRKYYFAAFLTYRIIFLCLLAFKVWKDVFDEPILDEQNAVANVCD